MALLTTPCRRCGALEAPASSPALGALSALQAQVREGVCEACWRAWLGFSVKWINEQRADLREPAVREGWIAQLRLFLHLDGGARDPWARWLDRRVRLEPLGAAAVTGTLVSLDERALVLVPEGDGAHAAPGLRFERDAVLTLRAAP